MDMYCPGFVANAAGQRCTPHVLVGTPQRCPACGGTATLAPGTVLTSGAETYTLTDILGIGGMGIVYKSTDRQNAEFVVKQLYIEDPAELPDAQRRFRREAQIQAGINNPALALGFGWFVDPAIAAVNPNIEFMVMEFVPGQDLEKVMTSNLGGTLDDDDVLLLGIQICDGLIALHNFVDPTTGQPDPIQHRDIKPANIILRPSNQICILDLGIARTVRRLAGTQAAGGGPRATMAGTFEYASPQQISGTNMSIRDDIYSVAATLFHLKTGAPFAGHYVADQTKGIVSRATEIDILPPAWRAAFRRAIHNDTNLRQRSAEEFKNDLNALLPPHLQQAAAAPLGPAAPQAAPTGPVAIRWRVHRAYMVNPNEWRQPVAGQLIRGRDALPGITVTPIMTDNGPGAMANNTPGTVVTSGLHGDFGLEIPDVTVPVTVDTREIVIIVEDPVSGLELYRETIELNRPGIAQRAKAKGAAGVGAVAHGAAAPFRAAGHGIAGVGRNVGAGAAIAGRKVGAGVAAVWNAMTSYQMVLAVAFLLAIATLVGIAMHWTWVWTLCPWLAFLAYRVARFSQRGVMRTEFWRMILPRWSAVWIGTWLAFFLKANWPG